jgi:RNA polymerase sigma-70 factor (ECF subfamily)
MLAFYLSALDTNEERDKLTRMYDLHKRELTRIAMNILRKPELAEDAVHDTFLEAIKHKDKIFSRSSTDFLRWCVVVVEGKCVDILRRRKHISESPSLDDEKTGEVSDDGEPLDIILTKREDYDLIRGCLPELDAENRQILWRKYVLGMSYKEIAEEMNMTPEQLTSRMARTKAKLRVLFEKRGGTR